MTALLIGYARVSTDAQDLTAQRDGLLALGVDPRAEAKSCGSLLTWVYEGGHGSRGGLEVSNLSITSEKARARVLIFPIRAAARCNHRRGLGSATLRR